MEENKKRKSVGGRKKLPPSERNEHVYRIRFSQNLIDKLEEKRRKTTYKSFGAYCKFLLETRSDKLIIKSFLDTRGLQELHKSNTLINQATRVINSIKESHDVALLEDKINEIYKILDSLENLIRETQTEK